MRSQQWKARNSSGLFLVPKPKPKADMPVPKSQRMSWGELSSWSFLGATFITVISFACAWLLPAAGGGSAFRAYSWSVILAFGLSFFLFSALAIFRLLVKVKWVEEEGPAKSGDISSAVLAASRARSTGSPGRGV